mgnify:FL=1
MSRDTRIVAIGGGTGLSNLLSGLKHKTKNITAIVAITDDGGSSGRIRKDYKMAPPGDIRNCLLALSNLDDKYKSTLNYRFKSDSNLYDHNMGNLLIAALNQQENSFSEAIIKAGLLLNVQGQVIPISDNAEAILKAQTKSKHILHGESEIGENIEKITDIWVEPPNITFNPLAKYAIDECDAVIIGPGSLYTSVITNFLFKGLAEAVNHTQKPIIFISNIANDNETYGFTIKEHIEEFKLHTNVDITHVICNSTKITNTPEISELYYEECEYINSIKVINADLLGSHSNNNHDPNKLTDTIFKVIETLS